MEKYFEIKKFHPGFWVWNNEKKGLEFYRSINGQVSKILLPRTSSIFLGSNENLANVKSVRFPESPSHRLRFSRFNQKLQLKTSEKVVTPSCPKPWKNKNKFVTLEDVKRVALTLMERSQRMRLACEFPSVLRSKELDDFLLAAIHYMYCFLIKRSKAKKPVSLLPSCTPPEKVDELLSLGQHSDAALRHLAAKYSVLILGGGREKKHHMACGKNKSSGTWSDLRFFESLYNFCTKVTWVTLWRKKLEAIQEEFGRIFRTEHFNTKLRLPQIQNIFGESQVTSSARGDRKPKRPHLQAVLRRCSPLLTSVLPTSIDKSAYLFEHHRLHPKVPKEGDKKIDSEYEIISRHGIIGEPMKNLHYKDLTPLEPGEEEEEEEEEEEYSS